MLYADPAQFDERFLDRLLPLLPPEKQPALQRITHARSRRESLLGWGLLLYAFRQRFPGTAFPAVGFGVNGKPFFKDYSLFFNISHTETLVCLAQSDTGEIGLDAQVRTEPSDAVLRKVLTAAEQEAFAAADDKALTFTRFWTQKEAFVKQTGEGLSHAFDTLCFAPFVGKDTFTAFGLQFATQTLRGAVVTQCAETLPEAEMRAVTQEKMEKVLFFEKDG